MVKIVVLPTYETSKVSDEYCKAHFPKRFERAERCKSTDDRLRSLGVGILLYEVLGLEEKDLKRLDKSKPVSQKTPFFFSVAHSGNYSVLGYGTKAVGIDLEKQRKIPLKIAERVFTAEEQAWIQSRIDDRFVLLWTIKEGLSKITGDGLSMPFHTINVLPLVRGGSIRIDEKVVYSTTYDIRNHTLTICYEGKQRDLSVSRLQMTGSKEKPWEEAEEPDATIKMIL